MSHKELFLTLGGESVIYITIPLAAITDRISAPVPPPEEDRSHRIHTPLLGINSEAFMYWQSNFDAVSSLLSEATSEPDPSPSWLLTIRGTAHLSQSDFSILYPHILAFLLKVTANPKRVLDINTSASLEFLSTVMPTRHIKVIGRGASIMNEDILELDTMEDLPEDRRPEDKDLALKLADAVPVTGRVMPKLQRKIKRAKVQSSRQEGVKISDEIIMHVKTSEQEVRAYRQKKGEEWELDEDCKGLVGRTLTR
jgi:platelet-activating factor acetylhydrolase